MKNAEKVKKIAKTVFTAEYRFLLARLKELRGRQRLTQRQLAARLGVHHSWVAKVELGERKLDILELICVLEALDADPLAVIAELIANVADSRKAGGRRAKHHAR